MLLSSLWLEQLKLLPLGVLVAGWVTASDCGDRQRLNDLAQSGIAQERHWYRAALAGDDAAAMALTRSASATQQLYWLELLVELDVAEAQFQLAKLTSKPALRSLLLQKAATQDHLEALFYIGQNNPYPSAKVNAYRQAAQRQHRPSQHALYQWYWLQGEYQLALPWLTQVAEWDANSAQVLAMHLWRQGEVQAAQQWFTHAAAMGDHSSANYLRLIANYWRKGVAPGNTPSVTTAGPCQMQLQFVATSLESVAQAVAFQQDFAADKRLRHLPICINQVVWLDEGTVPCQFGASNKQRITCHIEQLDKRFQPGDFSHLVIFARQGKANVNNGVMYLDLADQYSVFVHELAHFVGFVDEYPLSATLGERICRLDVEHPNIRVQQPAVIAAPSAKHHSQRLVGTRQAQGLSTLSSPELATADDPTAAHAVEYRYPARTCNNHSYQAYKLEQGITFLEYHDSGWIPQSYLRIWQQRLLNRRDLVPASLNMAHALEDSGSFLRAARWRQHFIAYRAGATVTELLPAATNN